ncbi:MAG: GntR family transcriptional regulator [Blautia sp.]|nr:GntR family transcriptional regulator [Blautia sp.]
MVLSVSKETTQDAVYALLKKGIMTLSLPPGTAMSTQEMATKLNVSRTPVREAFIRLHEEGLVDIFPQRQTIVSRINFTRVLQERFIRESLEIASLHLLMEKGPSAACLEKMEEKILAQEQCQKKKDYSAFILQDNEMHRVIFDEAGQSLAWETIMSVNGNYDRFRVLTVSNEETMNSTVRQHKLLIDLMRRGESQKVFDEMYDHVRKLHYEKNDLIRQYPDYFSADEDTGGFQIGSL